MNNRTTSQIEKVVSTLPLAEQVGFAAAKSSAELVEAAHQFDEIQGIGRGMLLAAIDQLERELTRKEVTKLIFQVGGDYAWSKPAQSFPRNAF